MCLMCTLETSLQIFTILGSLLAHIKPHLLVNEPMYEYCFPFNFQVSRWLGLRFSDSQVPACVLLLPSVAMIVISHLVDANTVVQDVSTLTLKRWGLGQVSRWWLYYIISLKLWIQELVLQAIQGGLGQVSRWLLLGRHSQGGRCPPRGFMEPCLCWSIIISFTGPPSGGQSIRCTWIIISELYFLLELLLSQLRWKIIMIWSRRPAVLLLCAVRLDNNLFEPPPPLMQRGITKTRGLVRRHWSERPLSSSRLAPPVPPWAKNMNEVPFQIIRLSRVVEQKLDDVDVSPASRERESRSDR